MASTGNKLVDPASIAAFRDARVGAGISSTEIDQQILGM
jgi:hypothetical protein